MFINVLAIGTDPKLRVFLIAKRTDTLTFELATQTFIDSKLQKPTCSSKRRRGIVFGQPMMTYGCDWFYDSGWHRASVVRDLSHVKRALCTVLKSRHGHTWCQILQTLLKNDVRHQVIGKQKNKTQALESLDFDTLLGMLKEDVEFIDRCTKIIS